MCRDLQERVEAICVWKKILEDNLKGKGTTFIGRTREDLKCYDCNGSEENARKINCKSYMVLED